MSGTLSHSYDYLETEVGSSMPFRSIWCCPYENTFSWNMEKSARSRRKISAEVVKEVTVSGVPGTRFKMCTGPNYVKIYPSWGDTSRGQVLRHRMVGIPYAASLVFHCPSHDPGWCVEFLGSQWDKSLGPDVLQVGSRRYLFIVHFRAKVTIILNNNNNNKWNAYSLHKINI
jgi:hypothetical protein